MRYCFKYPCYFSSFHTLLKSRSLLMADSHPAMRHWKSCTNRFSHLRILMVFFHIIISYSKRKKQAQQLASSYMLFHSIAFCITFGFVSYERILLIPILLLHLFIPLDAFDQTTKRKKNMVERNVHFIFSNNSLRNCL